MDYVISRAEHLELNKTGKPSQRLYGYWQDLIGKMPIKLQSEVQHKVFSLTKHPFLSEEHQSYSYNLCFYVAEASLELVNFLEEPENAVICMIDPV